MRYHLRFDGDGYTLEACRRPLCRQAHPLRARNDAHAVSVIADALAHPAKRPARWWHA